MSSKLTVISLAIATAGVLLSVPALSQPALATSTTTQSKSTNPAVKLASQYGTLAGSQTNAQSLIAGLRDGKAVTLISTPTGPSAAAPSATFTPATGKLGYGNINIALSLAKSDLEKQGITNPTPAQLAAALNGGTVATANGEVTMAGILAQRQDGLGWGQIANGMGVKLGALVSASKTDKVAVQSVKSSTAGSTKALASGGKSDKSNVNSGNSQGGGNAGGNAGGNGGGGGKK